MSEGKDFAPFFKAMIAEMQRHYPEHGDSWKTCSLSHLWKVLKRVIEDVDMNNMSHLLDVANVCGMMWLRWYKLEVHSSEQKVKKGEEE